MKRKTARAVVTDCAAVPEQPARAVRHTFTFKGRGAPVAAHVFDDGSSLWLAADDAAAMLDGADIAPPRPTDAQTRPQPS